MRRLSRKHLLHFLAALLGAVLLLALGFWFTLPRLLEERWLPGLAREYGFSSLELEVRRLSLSRLDLAEVRLDVEEGEFIRIDSLRFDYSWAELLRGHLRRAVISGLETSLQADAEGLAPPGGWPPEVLEKISRREEEPEEPAFSFGSLEVRNSAVNLAWAGKRERLPFTLMLAPETEDMRSFCFAVKLLPRGQEINTSGMVDLQSMTAALEFAGADLALGRFNDLWDEHLPALSGFSAVSGVIGRANFHLHPFEVKSVSAAGEWRHGSFFIDGLGKVEAGGERRTQAGDSYKAGPGAEFSLDYEDYQGNLQANGLFIQGEDWRLDEVKAKGRFQTSPDFWEDIRWQVDVDLEKMSFNTSGVDFQSRGKSFKMNGAGRYGLESGMLALEAAEWRLRDNSWETFSQEGFQARAEWGAEEGTTWEVLFPEINLAAADTSMEARIGEAAVEGESDSGIIDFLANSRWRQTPRELRFKRGEMVFKDYDVNLREISGSLPLHGILVTGTEAPNEITGSQMEDEFVDADYGEVRIGRMNWRQRSLGRVSLEAMPLTGGWAFSGSFQGNDKLFPGLVTELEAEARFTPEYGARLKAQASVRGWEISDTFSLAGIMSELPVEPELAGKIDAQADFQWHDGRPEMGLGLSWRQGGLGLADWGINFQGVEADLEWPDFFAAPGAGRQRIGFDKGEWGDLQFNNGRLQFRLEADNRIFIEQARAGWAGGRLSTHALSLEPEQEVYEFEIFADNLALTEVIHQLNLGKAAGEGSLNGRIPVLYRRGRIRLDDGFLYSTPGRGGSIRLLEDRIPEGLTDPRAGGQLALTRKALENFEYNWARLSLRTEESENDRRDELLHAELQLDGTPADVLPFVYSEKIGDWIRVEADVQGSRFENIRLDLNFRLPLNEVLGVGLDFRDILRPDRY